MQDYLHLCSAPGTCVYNPNGDLRGTKAETHPVLLAPPPSQASRMTGKVLYHFSPNILYQILDQALLYPILLNTSNLLLPCGSQFVAPWNGENVLILDPCYEGRTQSTIQPHWPRVKAC